MTEAETDDVSRSTAQINFFVRQVKVAAFSLGMAVLKNLRPVGG